MSEAPRLRGASCEARSGRKGDGISTRRTGVRVAVVGGGLGGLSAAIHLRRLGFEVVLYEGNARVGGRANRLEANGFVFDTGPTLLNYPWVFEGLFRSVGRSLDDYVTLVPVDPSITFCWPDGVEFRLSSTLPRLIQEVERMEAGGAPGLFAFLADGSEKYRIAFEKMACRDEENLLRWVGCLSWSEFLRVRPWRSLDRELGSFFREQRIRDALGAYAMYLGGSPRELPALFAMLPYAELACGLWTPKGGMYELVMAIERLAREMGVEILLNQRVRKIVARQEAVAGIEMQSGQFLPYSVVVSNVDVPTTWADLLEWDGGREKRRRSLRRIKMTPSVITFYWGVRGQVSGAGHHTIFLPRDTRATFRELVREQRVPRHLAFYLSIASQTHATLAPFGNSALSVLVPLPVISRMADTRWKEFAGELKAQILERLASRGIRLAPGDILTEEILTPLDWANRFGLYDASAFGASHRLLQMGPFRPPNHDRYVRGLYYVGASTVPGTGLPIVVLSGEMTAERIGRDVR